MCKIIVLVGCSSSGKDTILKKIVKESNIIPIISTTSRPKREGEKNGIEYYFVSKKEFEHEIKQNSFIEYRKYNVFSDKGEDVWFYGIKKTQIDLYSDKTYIAIMDLNGLNALKKYLKNQGVSKILKSYYINCNGQERIKRSMSREGMMNDEQVKEVCRRFLDDYENIHKLALKNCDIILENNNKMDYLNIIKYFKEKFSIEKDKDIIRSGKIYESEQECSF